MFSVKSAIVSAAISKVLNLMELRIPAATVALNTCEAYRIFIFSKGAGLIRAQRLTLVSYIKIIEKSFVCCVIQNLKRL